MIQKNKIGEWRAVGLFLLIVVAYVIWPSFQNMTSMGMATIAKPFLKLLGRTNDPDFAEGEKKHTQDENLAIKVRSMEFRIQRYAINSEKVQAWSEEWGNGPSEKINLLRLLLRQLPEVFAAESPVALQQDLIQMITSLSKEGQKAQPDNAFFFIAEALAFFYSNNDQSAFSSLKEGQVCPKIDAGLNKLNHSEALLWGKNTSSWMVPSPAQRIWSLRLERPLHTLSRGLALQEKTLLRKYNLEQAIEVALIHLGLAVQVSQAGWTPADQAIARALANRALEPFWTATDRESTPALLAEEFFQFLEEHGDKLSQAKARSWISILSDRDKMVSEHMKDWRKIQAFGSWNVAGVISSLMLQTVSLLIVWLTMMGFLDRKTLSSSAIHPPPSFLDQWFVPHLAFVIVPLFWTFSNWVSGGIFLTLGLFLGWVMWGFAVLYRNDDKSFFSLYTNITHAFAFMSVVTLMATSACAWISQYRLDRIHLLMDKGWLN